MLTAAGVAFEVVPADVDEGAEKIRLKALAASPADVVLALSIMKAQQVARRYPGTYVLGSDQTLSLADGTMFDKPLSRTNLKHQLLQLSGTTHALHSAAALVENGVVVWQAVESVSMTMRSLSDEFVENYLDAATADLLGCVGGYQIEGSGLQLFTHIEGSYHAILGLPLLPLLSALRDHGILAR